MDYMLTMCLHWEVSQAWASRSDSVIVVVIVVGRLRIERGSAILTKAPEDSSTFQTAGLAPLRVVLREARGVEAQLSSAS